MGKMTKKGLDIVVAATRKVQQENPEILQPLARFFEIDVDERLDNPEYRKDLWYNY
jgi:4-hydroxy-tetrahydrodipicolinate synthase